MLQAFRILELYRMTGLASRKLLLLLFIFLFAALPTRQAFAQDAFSETKVDPPMEYDEIPVLVMVQGYENFYMDVLYTTNNKVYLNVEELFKTLNIACRTGQQGDSLSGFIDNESRTYVIDFNKDLISVGDARINVANALLNDMGRIYLESSVFEQAFGIQLQFNFRSLSINLSSSFELPVVKQKRLENIRKNVTKIKGEIEADTVFQRDYHAFKFGVLDWSVASSQVWQVQTLNHFRVGLGAELLYGEADLAVDYYNSLPFDERNVKFQWRWVDNDKHLIRQAMVGNISEQSIAFLGSPLLGVVVRNAPTTIRKANGYYTIQGATEPNWTVELYMNNVLIDYKKADASGAYVFNVPMLYGFNTLKLKFFGPMGEERSEERTMNMPYTVMAARKLEYGLCAGVLQDGTYSRFGKGEINYGVNNFFTVGGGFEYLSSIPKGAFIPYAKATLQPFSKLIVMGEYAYGVKTRVLADYYFIKNALLQIDYSRFVKGQQATRFNAQEERKAKLSVPYRIKKLSGFAKLEYAQFVYSDFSYYQANLMLSAYHGSFSANSTTQMNWVDKRSAYVTTDMALSYHFRHGFHLRTAVQYNISQGRFMTIKTEFEKSIKKAYLTLAYQRNILYNDNYLNVGFKMDLSFARVNAAVSYSQRTVTTSETAQGSLAFGGGNGKVHASNNSSIAKGGIVLYPFLDINQNGVFDPGERRISVEQLRVQGGTSTYVKKDSSLMIADLNAFCYYLIEFSNNQLDNIAWRFAKKSYKVLVDPNQFKRIDVPVIVIGEANGTVLMQQQNEQKGVERMIIRIYSKSTSKQVAEILSEPDGYFTYFGLAAGNYVAKMDSLQLVKLGFAADAMEREFTILPLHEGDIATSLDFVVTKIYAPIKGETKKIIEKEAHMIYTVQIAAARSYVASEFYKKKYKLTAEVLYFQKDGWYKYVTGIYPTEKEAQAALVKLGVKGFVTTVDRAILMKD